MNPIFLQNNEGLSFIYQGDKSIQVKDRFGIDLGEASHIYLNDLAPQEMESYDASEGEDRERLVTQFLHDRFATLGKKHRTFEVQCYIHQNRPFVVFQPYGLQGGGYTKIAAYASGACKIASGILLTVVPLAATAATGGAATPSLIAVSGGAGLTASGIAEMAYAWRTPEENMSLTDWARQSTIGFAAGAAGGAAGAGVTAVAGPSLHAFATNALSGAAYSAASTTASTVTEAAIKGDPKVLKRLTPKRFAASTAVGAVTGGVSSLTKAGVETGSQYLCNSSTAAASDLAAKAAVGAAAGAASGSAVKITENFINQHTFLQVTYGSKPDNYDIEPGKLYVYIHGHKIHFQSVDEKGRGNITVIKDQRNFLVPSGRETQIEKIIDVLQSNGRKGFNDKQTKFILESAAKHHHVPLNLLSGVADAAAVGASTGAVIGLSKAAADRMKVIANQVKATKEAAPSTKERPLFKRVRVESQTAPQKASRTTEGGYFLRGKTTHQVLKSENPDTQKTQIATITTERTPSLRFRKSVRVEQQDTKVTSIAEEKLADRSCLKRRVSQVVPSEPDTKKPKGDIPQLASKTLLGKRTKTESHAAAPGESPVQTKKIETRSSALLGKKSRLKGSNPSPKHDKQRNADKVKQALESEKEEAECIVIQATPGQIAAAQTSIDKANQRLANLFTLSTYSEKEMKTKATEIYNHTKNLRLNRGEAIVYIEQFLSDNYDIPMGTSTDSLKAAFVNNPDKYAPTPILSALRDKNSNGNAIPLVKQDKENATLLLNNLREPECATQVQPQTVPSNINILELVTHSENDARNTGYKDNINVQMKYLTKQLVGADRGDQYDKVYRAYLEADFKWETYHGSDKPTQYGFLTAITDLIVNGTTTVPVEIKTQPWYQRALGFLGTTGVGFQLNGSGLQMGTINQPNLVTLYSTEKPTGIEGFQLPVSSSLSPSQPVTSDPSSSVIPTSFNPTQPSAPAPAQLPIQNVNSVPASSKPSIAQPTTSTPSHTPPSRVSGSGTQAEINPSVYLVADIVQPIFQALDKVPGLDGLGSYVSGAIDKVTIPLSAFERVGDPKYQNEPTVQKIGCGIWGTSVEVVGVLPAVPIGLANPVSGAVIATSLSHYATKAGDDAQKNCHEVIDMFKPSS